MKKIILFTTVILSLAGAFFLSSFKNDVVRKKLAHDTYVYLAGKRKIQTGTSTSIIPSELIDDANADGLPDNWASGSIAHTPAGTKLAYIEFDTFFNTLVQAVSAVNTYYTSVGTLPGDGGVIPSGGSYIWIYRN